MKEYLLINGQIYTESQKIEHGFIHIKDSKIMEIGSDKDRLNTLSKSYPTVDAQGHHVIPGFIDIHIHGGYGEDAMDASMDGLKHLSEQLLSEGTTSFLATTMTQSDDSIHRALQNIANYYQIQNRHDAAKIVGIHLEGPFISEHKVGAQHPKYVQRPSIEKIKTFQKTANQLIKIITFAPEVDGATDTLKALNNDIIFSMGHTVATYDEANEAVDNGAKHITHLYNAATGFGHREPGVFGAAWLNQNLNTEIIVDGVHSHPAAVAMAYQNKGNEHMYLITDAMRAKGMPEGEYDLGGQNVIVKNEEARLDSGALAGSILKMNDGLRHLITYTGASIKDLWRVTSWNQAIALGIDQTKGSIKVGKDADIVIVDDTISVLMTIKNGYIHTF
ncbi:N-acetylglucosamine-6-phosphate deacetylase [Staphylococcus warneri]|uniref:N-acetylglucosamine-6-phosphate deacetylase n=1 Tax=Staphylococcus warneri TaxID=1292 RepID=UPI0016432523|nr:N-acetylglucosamine-6-phosphate deacetylase [Staphylococcus warneri]MBC3134484.1 N-acetylglucosamine-6-phosphate deacetylase [Staphylococcus warneri]